MYSKNLKKKTGFFLRWLYLQNFWSKSIQNFRSFSSSYETLKNGLFSENSYLKYYTPSDIFMETKKINDQKRAPVWNNTIYKGEAE